jgi:hypothetical protein
VTHAPVAFYAIADERYFVGLVALVNSLRLAGHDEQIVVLDTGLTAGQRDLISPHATVLESGDGRPAVLLKPVAPLRDPAEVMVLVDADVVVLRHLGKLLALARAGSTVVFAEPGLQDRARFAAQWAETLGLDIPSQVRYVNAGMIVFPREAGESVLRELDRLQGYIDLDRTWLRDGERDDPFYYADQDVLNAILARRGDVEILDRALGPFAPFDGLRLVDERGLSVVDDRGAQSLFLHRIFEKPWLAKTDDDVYARLLRRLLLDDDVAIRVDPAILPLRLRRGPAAELERRRIALGLALHRNLRGRLGIRRRVAAWRARSV